MDKMRTLSMYNNISDLKNMNQKELQKLSMDIRVLIMKRCSTVGGHLATNLANVEMTMMLYRHFNPKNGYIVFDGAHQGYTHKILTDRKDVFLDKNSYIFFGTDFSLMEQNVSNFKFDKVYIECNYDDKEVQSILDSGGEILLIRIAPLILLL